MLHCAKCIRTCLGYFISGTREARAPSVSSVSGTLPHPHHPLRQRWITSRSSSFAARRSHASPPAPPRVVGQHDVDGGESAMHAEKEHKKKQWAIAQEIKYLRDPLKLSENTARLLREGDKEKALEIVRAISKYGTFVVAWNHLIDYEMSQKRVNRAMEIYNDMKKRRQPPDAHTYTIVLRGLGWNYKYSRSPERALTVYHSMFAENSPVKPSLIHTNAVLQVCALANDMEALWGVAAKLPGAGKNAADTTTFTIILNAIRHNMVEDVDTNPTQGDWEVRSRRRDAQSQCRRIWADVVERWRKGDLIIDESLVHAMGRTLVMGNRHDIDNVLDLVEQTMAIPRQLPRKDRKFKDSDKSLIEDAERDAEEYNENAGHDGGPPLVSQESNHSSLGETPNAQEILPGTEFLPLVNPEKRVVYAVPSWKTLSLVLNACSFLEAWLPAEKYWDLLTSSEGRYRIPPDRENYVQYLRNLRQRHASKKCSSLLQEMRSRMGELPERKAFRIALSACCRDTRNPNVVENAKSIFGMMDIVSTDVDTACLSDYINVVVGATLGSWRDVARALDPVWVAIDNLENPSGFGSAGDAQRPVKPSHEGGIICDKLVNVWEQCLMKAKSEVTPDEWRSMVERRNKLQGWKQQLGGQRIPANHSRRQRSSSDEQEHYSRSRSTFKSRDRSSFQVRENDSPRSKTPYDRDQQPRARVRYH